MNLKAAEIIARKQTARSRKQRQKNLGKTNFEISDEILSAENLRRIAENLKNENSTVENLAAAVTEKICEILEIKKNEVEKFAEQIVSAAAEVLRELNPEKILKIKNRRLNEN